MYLAPPGAPFVPGLPLALSPSLSPWNPPRAWPWTLTHHSVLLLGPWRSGLCPGAFLSQKAARPRARLLLLPGSPCHSQPEGLCLLQAVLLAPGCLAGARLHAPPVFGRPMPFSCHRAPFPTSWGQLSFHAPSAPTPPFSGLAHDPSSTFLAPCSPRATPSRLATPAACLALPSPQSQGGRACLGSLS